MSPRPTAALRLGAMIAAGVAAAIAIYVGIDAWIGARTMITIEGVTARPVDLLAPEWLKLACVVPFFFVARHWSLTDLAISQQVLQAGLRSLVIVTAAVALARPSWVTRESKVATVALVDVSASVSDKQLDAARAYVDELRAAAGGQWLEVVTFAEKPRVAPRERGGFAIGRHDGASAGSDVQAAMQLAYGLFPPATCRAWCWSPTATRPPATWSARPTGPRSSG